MNKKKYIQIWCVCYIRIGSILNSAVFASYIDVDSGASVALSVICAVHSHTHDTISSLFWSFHFIGIVLLLSSLSYATVKYTSETNGDHRKHIDTIYFSAAIALYTNTPLSECLYLYIFYVDCSYLKQHK